MSNPQSWNRYSYVTNRPLIYSDPTGHKCNPDDGCETPHGDKGGAGDDNKGGTDDDDETFKRLENRLKTDDLKVLAMAMYFEYNGYYPRDVIDYDIVYMKFWVFLNLISIKADEINSGKLTYKNSNPNGMVTGTWDSWLAIAHHESPLRPALVGLEGWDPDSFYKQRDALLNNANAMLSGGTAEGLIFEKFLKEAVRAEADWNQYGSGSPQDPTRGSWSFVDHDASYPIASGWNVVTDPFIFEEFGGTTYWKYTRFDDPPFK